jgi:hypothetical protein
MNNDSDLTRIRDYIKETLPWAHGHQLNALTTFVSAIFDKQTGRQAELARTQSKQEAACKRLSRLIHNERLSPKWLAESIAHQALSQVPRFGKVRFTIDWTTEDEQHLLTVSLVIGRRAVPIYWRAYHQSVLKGRMHLYERAVIKRAFKLIFQYIKPSRVRLTADRGFADEPLFALLQQLRVRFVIRVKGCVKVRFRREWRKLNRFGFHGACRHQTLGRLLYCEKSPRRLWVHQSRARNKQGQLETWSLVSNFARDARRATTEYARRFSCEIVFTQMTKANFFTSRAGRDDIADLDFAVIDDYAIDKQFDQLSALGEEKLIQSWLQSLAERLNACSQRGHIQLSLCLRF